MKPAPSVRNQTPEGSTTSGVCGSAVGQRSANTVRRLSLKRPAGHAAAAYALL